MNTTANKGLELPDGILEEIFQRLNGSELKTCRLVCSAWNNIISWTFYQKTCFTFNGKAKLMNTSWKHYFLPNYIRNIKLSKQITTYLIPQSIVNVKSGEVSPEILHNSSLLKPWPALRFKKSSNQQFNCMIGTWKSYLTTNTRQTNINRISPAVLLENPPKLLQQIFDSVTTLEFVNCQFKIATLVKFLQYFKNLTTFIDDMSIFNYFQWNEIVCPDTSNTHFTSTEQLVTKACKNILFPSVKSVILKKETAYINTMPILLMLELTVRDLEEFTLHLNEENRFPLFHMDYVEKLGLFLLKHGTTLKKLELNWWHNYYEMYFEDCLRTLQIFNLQAATPLIITDLNLTVQWIFILRDDFQQIFIPFIKELQFLKKLYLSKIMFEPNVRTISILKQLTPKIQEAHSSSMKSAATCSQNLADFDFTFGLFVCDPLNDDRALSMSNYRDGFDPRRLLQNHQLLRVTRDLLKHPIIKSSMLSLHVAFDLSLINCLEELLPIVPEPELYEKLKELNITSSKSTLYSKLFSNYHIDLLTKSFPNLAILGIYDGPQFSYYKKTVSEMASQYNNMSPANIGNAELQIILTNLIKLKSLRLRVRFANLTDGGLTGVKDEICQQLKDGNSWPNKSISHIDKDGVSFSNIPGLEELMLKGLSADITNVTAFYAFNECIKLKILLLCGQFQFTKDGYTFLQEKTRGFKLQINDP